MYWRPLLIALSQNPIVWAVVLLLSGHWGWAVAALLFVPSLVLLALPFACWDLTPSADSMGKYPSLIRGDLPSWLAWLSTPNERLPGGTYEPTVYKVWERFGPFWCSWYWLGVRNRLYGLSAAFGVPVDGSWPVEPGYYERDGLWWLRKPIFGGRLQFKAGYRTYFIQGRWLAVPAITITKP